MSTWDRPVKRAGIIVQGGYGDYLEWGSPEEKAQRKRKIENHIKELQQSLLEIDNDTQAVSGEKP